MAPAIYLIRTRSEPLLQPLPAAAAQFQFCAIVKYDQMLAVEMRVQFFDAI